MNKIFILLAVLSTSLANATTYYEAEAVMNSMASKQKERTEQFIGKEGEAVNAAWQKTGPCFKLGIQDRTELIFKVSESGQVKSIWSKQKHAKASCLKEIILKSKFPVPPYQPYYLKVVI